MSDPKDIYEPIWTGFVEHLERRDFRQAKKVLDFGWATIQGLPLIDMRCKRFHTHGDGETALQHFSADADHDVFKWLLMQGADWKSMASYGAEAPVPDDVSVTLAIKGSVRNLKTLIDHVGYEPLDSTASKVHMSLMHYACGRVQPAMVLTLLEYRPNFLEATDDIKRTPEECIPDDAAEAACITDVLRSWKAQRVARNAIAEACAGLAP